MTMTADYENAPHTAHRTPEPPAQMPVPVQILSTIMFGAFAIPVTIVALNIFWPAGVAIAIILAWRGGFAPVGAPPATPRSVEEAVKSLVPTTKQKETGNAAFDAYRRDMIARLEKEQHHFEAFLARLREAKDKSEFEHFMDERAQRTNAHQTDA